VSSLGDSIQKFRDKLGSLGKRGGGGDGAGAGKAKFDAKAAIVWVKRNPVIVASVAVMIAAPVAAWWFSSELHAEADKQTAAHAAELSALEKLEKTQVEIALPGQDPLSQTGVVTPRLVAAYESLTGRLRADALAVQRAALKHNQKDRTALPTSIHISPANINTIAESVHTALMTSMQATLAAARAGSPPSEESTADQVQRRHDQFIAGEKKADRKSLTAEELSKLHAALAEKRLQVYADTAANISFYADVSRLGLPASYSEAGNPPSEGRLFYWLWRAWVNEDIIRALAKANQPYRSVLEAPVKRLVGVVFRDREDLGPPPGPASGASAAGAEGAHPEPVAIAPIDPKQPVPYAFNRTFSGRQSNPLYDVRECDVTLVVATRLLPEVLNAIARENFMTVTRLRMVPADAFADAAEGFIYGPEPVSRVTLTIESIWLREWIGRLMPKDVQMARGTDGRTVDDPPAAPAGEPAAPHDGSGT
jgi:hypothetical protein